MEEKKEQETTDVLFSWEAPARPFKKRDASFFQTIIALALLIVVILFFIREWLIIGTALAVVFVAYALASVPPPIAKYQITKKGLWIDEVFYRYSELSEYWFEEHLETRTLVVRIPARTIGRLTLVIPRSEEDQINKLMQEKLVFREKPLKTLLDSLSDWMKKKVPLEER